MEYTFRYRRGEVSVVEANPVSFDAARPAARRMGRWAVELWRGAELIERVRFDFPLLAAEPAPQDRHEEPIGLAAGAESEYTVLLPASPRVGRAVLVDRATGERLSLPWPVAR